MYKVRRGDRDSYSRWIGSLQKRNRTEIEMEQNGSGTRWEAGRYGPIAEKQWKMENTRDEWLLTVDCARALDERLKYRIGVRVRSKPRRLLFTTNLIIETLSFLVVPLICFRYQKLSVCRTIKIHHHG